MKKLLFIMAAVVCLLSCRSVKNEGFIHGHHASIDADSLAAVSHSERKDSTNYYHGVIDSLSSELRNVKKMFRDLYVRDSVNTNQYRADNVNVKDTTWMQINADGSVTYHHYMEKNSYSYQQLERYRHQIVKDSKATIDSLIERNEYLQTRYVSISQYQSLADSVTRYRARLDSVSNIVNEREKTTIKKNSLWAVSYTHLTLPTKA